MKLEIQAVDGLPEVAPGDNIAALIAERSDLQDGDIVVIAQKIVSKAEGQLRDLAAVTPSAEAERLAAVTEKDPRLVQLILDESNEVLRAVPGVLIVETTHGFVCANAGIDASNLAGAGDAVLLLPRDPDASARAIRAGIAEHAGRSVAVIVADSFGRAWRSGQADVAIGCAGIEPLLDLRGQRDSAGRELAATVIAVADELASAADLARTKTSGRPAVLVRGRGDLLTPEHGPGAAASLRERSADLFREPKSW